MQNPCSHSEEEVENVKSLRHTDGQTDAGHNSIRKSQVSKSADSPEMFL
jgi:hypothetical protein